MLSRQFFHTMTSINSNLIDGKNVALSIQEELKIKIQEENIQPCLATILVGNRPDSQVYVRMKRKLAQELGIKIKFTNLEHDVSDEEILKVIDTYNEDEEVNGILVQLPLPNHINEETVLKRINPLKDVDGFHEVNIGRLAIRGREPMFIPCTPKGCLELLKHYNVQLGGKNVVIIGRSNTVGIPLSLMLLRHNATVTICHSHTQNLPDIVGRADIVVAAIGRPEFVKGKWIKEGCVVIDVGINSIPDPSQESGRRLVGDVEFEEAVKRASLITPVPGGVGPMTVCQLMVNSYHAFKIQNPSNSQVK